MVALDDYDVPLQLRVWLADERAHLDTRTELREKLFEALRAGGVAMPFETLGRTCRARRLNAELVGA